MNNNGSEDQPEDKITSRLSMVCTMIIILTFSRLLVFLIIFFCFCFSNEKKLDNHTFSNFQEIMQSNINLTLTIDFDQKM